MNSIPIHGASYMDALCHLESGGLVTIQDTHLGAPHEMFSYNEVLSLLKKGAIGLGDLVDLANCNRNEAPIWKSRITYMADQFNYIYGNHEIFPQGKENIKNSLGIFTHGHFTWTPKKIARWQAKRPGRSFWRFQIYKLKHLRSKQTRKLKPSPKRWAQFHQYCRENSVTDLFIGHTHRYLNERNTYTFSDGYIQTIKLTACPRGFSLH